MSPESKETSAKPAGAIGRRSWLRAGAAHGHGRAGGQAEELQGFVQATRRIPQARGGHSRHRARSRRRERVIQRRRAQDARQRHEPGVRGRRRQAVPGRRDQGSGGRGPASCRRDGTGRHAREHGCDPGSRASTSARSSVYSLLVAIIYVLSALFAWLQEYLMAGVAMRSIYQCDARSTRSWRACRSATTTASRAATSSRASPTTSTTSRRPCSRASRRSSPRC